MKIDHAGDQPTSFKLSPDLLKQFRIAAAQRGRKLTSVVSELITQWVSEKGTETFESTSDLGSLLGIQSEADVSLVRRFLRVLHSRKAGLGRAIKSNLEEFEWAADAWDAQQMQVARDAEAHATDRAGKPEPATGDSQVVDESGGDRGRDPERAERIRRGIAAVEKAAREPHGRKARNAPRVG